MDEPGKQAGHKKGSKSPTKTREGPISLYPLSLEEAVSVLLKAKPEKKSRERPPKN